MNLLTEIENKKKRLAQAKKVGDEVMVKLWTKVVKTLEKQLKKRMGR